MTKPYWTPEKKDEYAKLLQRREQDREYHRQYMNKARHSGKYKYYRDEGKVVYKKDENDEKRSRK